MGESAVDVALGNVAETGRDEMKAEVIIACRQELPENLGRTVEGLLERIGEGDTIRVVLDGPEQPEYDLPEGVLVESPFARPRGCGMARHHGVMQTDADVVVFVDGHMAFPEGWMGSIKAHLAEHPHDLTCNRMQSIKRDWSESEGQLYWGARLATHCTESNEQYWGLAAKWNRGEAIKQGRIGAIMGASYAMTRDHYVNGMGGCYKILEAWGCNQTLPSVLTWFAGGRVWLLPEIVQHMYAAPHLRGPLSAGEALEVWANRLAVLEVLPMPTKVRMDLRSHLMKSSVDWSAAGLAVAARGEAIAELREHCKGFDRKWSGFAKTWLSDARQLPLVDTETRGDLFGADAQRNGEKNEGGGEPQMNTDGHGSGDKPPARKAKANYGPRENRRTCHKCGSGASAVNVTRQVHRMIVRYRTCEECGQKRTTQEVVEEAA